MDPFSSEEMDEFLVRCHCGRVQGRFQCSTKTLIGWDCNCSDCSMRGNVQTVVRRDRFRIDMREPLEDATILYQWGTKSAVRRFCKTCGILAWYTPRSDPAGVGITINCVDWTKGGTRAPPVFDIKKFDGIHFEESMEKLTKP